MMAAYSLARFVCKTTTSVSLEYSYRTDAEAETPILWPPDATNSLEKTLRLGKIEGGSRRR